MLLARSKPWAFLGYLLIHAFIVVGLVTPEYPDSATYEHLSVFGADRRLPTVPLLFKIFPTDALRVAVQTLLAAAAWWFLASVASEMLRDRRARVGLAVAILALGVVGPIASWNSAILSESTAISLTALLIAAWVRYALTPERVAASLAVVVTIFWTFTRQPHVLFVACLAVVAVAVALAKSDAKQLRCMVAALLVLIAIAGFLEIQRNQELSQNNTGAIIQNRILRNPSWTRWFLEHGMPSPVSLSPYVGTSFKYRPGESPAFFVWLRSKGTSTYLHFLVEHPRYTFIDPIPSFSGERESLHHPNRSLFGLLQPDPTPSLLSPTVNYGRHRSVLPTPLEELMFDQGQIGDIVLLALVGGILGWVSLKRWGRDRRFVVPLAAAVSAVPQGYVVWLGGGEAVGELDRLSMVTAVSLRIGLWITLGVAIDRLLTHE